MTPSQQVGFLAYDIWYEKSQRDCSTLDHLTEAENLAFHTFLQKFRLSLQTGNSEINFQQSNNLPVFCRFVLGLNDRQTFNSLLSSSRATTVFQEHELGNVHSQSCRVTAYKMQQVASSC